MAFGGSLSRREFTLSMAAAPGLQPTAVRTNGKLMSLWREFDREADKINNCLLPKDQEELVFERLELLEGELVTAQATTIEAVVAKALAACWTRVGDLDAASETSADRRLALSIVRDLVCLYAPEREWGS
jgi:hypothetical protein